MLGRKLEGKVKACKELITANSKIKLRLPVDVSGVPGMLERFYEHCASIDVGEAPRNLENFLLEIKETELKIQIKCTLTELRIFKEKLEY